MKKTHIESALRYLELPLLDKEWYEKARHYLRGGNGGEHGLLLYGLIRKYNPTKILDIGTARGFSAICIAKGLIDNHEEHGFVFTIDVIPQDRPYEWHGRKHSVSDPAIGKMLTRQQLLEPFDDSLKQKIIFLTGKSREILSPHDWKNGNIDFAFIDGEHTYSAVKEDFENIKRILNPGGIVVFDDYHPGCTNFCMGLYELRRTKYPGVRRVVEEALAEGNYILTALTIRKGGEYGLALCKKLD